MTAIKPDFVVVGSTALCLHGLHVSNPRDIDVVTNTLEGFTGSIHTYFTNSKHSQSGKRAHILVDGVGKIDIFVENYMPAYEIIGGIRVATVPAIRFYYVNLLPVVAEHWKTGILDILKILSYGK